MTQPKPRRAALFAACLTLAAGLLSAPEAVRAHAKLLRSEPKPKSGQPRPPQAVELWFSEELQAGFNAVEVRDGQGNRYESGGVTLEEGGRKARAELRGLPAGAYTVEWRALSADGHALKGKFTFTVEAPAAPAAAGSATPRPAPPPVGQEQAPSSPVVEGDVVSQGEAGEEASAAGSAESLLRWLGYLSMMALAGGFAAWLLVLGPALRPGRDGGVAPEAVGAAARRSLMLFRLSIIALILSTLSALVLKTAAVHGVGLGGALTPSRLAGLIAGTGYGKSWLIQAAGSAALLAVVLILGHATGREPAGRRKGLWTAGLAASALLMVGPSLTGHAAVAARHYPLAALSDWLHLAAGALWVGGLFHLALALPPALGRVPAGLRAEVLGRVIRLFTRAAVPAVALVLLAGLYNSWLHLGGWGALRGTAYGRTLLAKLLLVLGMLALGGLNNFYFGGRVRRGAAGRGFVRSVRIEAALGVLVLLVTAFLVFTTPGRNDAAEAPASRMDAGNTGAADANTNTNAPAMNAADNVNPANIANASDSGSGAGGDVRANMNARGHANRNGNRSGGRKAGKATPRKPAPKPPPAGGHGHHANHNQ